jgi:hypothetical protein
MRLPRGLALGTVLLVTTAVVLLAFMVAAVCTLQMHFVQGWIDRISARHLAESVLAQASELILSSNGALPLPQQTLQMQIRQGGDAWLSFASAENVPDAHIPPSINNMNLTSSVPGWRRSVPARTAQLLGVGVVNALPYGEEMLLHLEAFPYAVAANGPIVSKGGLLVGAVDTSSGLGAGLQQIQGGMLPADLGSNSTLATGIVLASGDLIEGDVQCRGGVSAPVGTVRGEIRCDADPIPMQLIDVTSYNPAVQNKIVNPMGSGKVAGGPIEGYNCADGDIEFTGDIDLKSAVLYVAGNLQMDGRVKGTGAIFATGNVTFQHASDLATDNVLALVSSGNVTLNGSGPDQDYFQGVVYTQGNFAARQVTIAGYFAAAGNNSSVQLDNVRVAAVSDYASINFTVVSRLPPPSSPPASGGAGGTTAGTVNLAWAMSPLFQAGANGPVCEACFGLDRSVLASTPQSQWATVFANGPYFLCYQSPATPTGSMPAAPSSSTPGQSLSAAANQLAQAYMQADPSMSPSQAAQQASSMLLYVMNTTLSSPSLSGASPSPTVAPSSSPSASATATSAPTTSSGNPVIQTSPFAFDFSRFLSPAQRVRVLLVRQI